MILSALGSEACTIELYSTEADRLSVFIMPDTTPPHSMGRFKLLNKSLLFIIQRDRILCFYGGPKSQSILNISRQHPLNTVIEQETIMLSIKCAALITPFMELSPALR